MSSNTYEEEIGGFIYREYTPIGRPRILLVGPPDTGLVEEIAAAHLIRSLELGLPGMRVEKRGIKCIHMDTQTLVEELSGNL